MSDIGLEDLAQSALRAQLAADATIAAGATEGVHMGNPAASVAPPYVVVDVLMVEDAHTFAERAYLIALVEVRAVVRHRGAGVPRAVLELAEAARVVAEAGIVTADVKVSGGVRVQRVAREDVFDGVRHVHRGGVYRVMVQAP